MVNWTAAWCNVDNRKKMIAGGVWLGVSLLLFYCFIYNDILETMRVSISFWDELFAGRVRYFYASSWEMTPFAYTKTVHATYDFPIYIIFSLWNFPLWIVEHFFDINIYESLICLMWGKTLILVISILMTRALYRLCKTLDMPDERAGLVCILFLTSNFFMTSVIIMSAYDIIAMCLSIEGINYYFKDNKKGFLLCFMLAVPLKLFPLLIFVPLLLLREKKILHVAGNTLMTVLPILVFRLLLPCRAVYGEPETIAFHLSNALKGTENDGMLYWYVAAHKYPAVLSQMYPPFFLWALILLCCYFLKTDTTERLKKRGIYVCFLMYAVLFATCLSNPYWILFMVPFAAILMGQNYKYLYVNLVIETIFTWGMILGQIFSFPWCYGNALAASMLLPKIFGAQNTFIPVTPLTVLQKLDEVGLAQGFLVEGGNSIFCAGIVLFAIINFPGWKREFAFLSKDEKPIWQIMGLRVVAGIGIACIPVLLHIAGLWLR